jgi:murein DD-endopeptidase MepM/ murein hydrolase activator NlpD
VSLFGFHLAIAKPISVAAGDQPVTPPVAAPRVPVPARLSPSGWIRPVDAPVWGGFHNPSNPDHQGVDLGAAQGTPIRAAAAGVVVRVRCNAPDYWGCDQAGNASIPGCGWYVDIRHDGAIYTRYCHQLHHPDVNVGDTVAAGQVIGVVGDSGNSGAPHLHFEVHLGNEDTNAVDPVAFMAQHGAPLGIN